MASTSEGTKVGILGGGQLGRMLALAGYPLGFRFSFLDTVPDAVAGHLAALTVDSFNVESVLSRFSEDVDVVTYEFENVPVVSAEYLSQRVPVYPPAEALRISQDRLTEKLFFTSLGVPTPKYIPVSSRLDLESALKFIGFPAVLKTRRMGYDGKGQYRFMSGADVERDWQHLTDAPFLLEEWIPYEREVSILAMRDRAGRIEVYPLVQNVHQDGILRMSRPIVSDGSQHGVQGRARKYATDMLQALHYVGMMAVEFFDTNGDLRANEFAPRVHNSGHWTIEGAETSQFENHLRAITGLPLGSTRQVAYTAMVNIIGVVPDFAALLGIPGVHLHWYGKVPRPGRKLGHITIRSEDDSELDERLRQTLAVLKMSGA